MITTYRQSLFLTNAIGRQSANEATGRLGGGPSDSVQCHNDGSGEANVSGTPYRIV